MSEFDVVVVGAGPVGLLAAVELTLAGVRVVVLERLAAVNTTIKALAVGPLGSEALQRRGMAAAIAAAEARSFAAMEQAGSDMRGRMVKFRGHFGGLFITRPASENGPERRMHAVDQQGLESMLGERARALGIEVRRGCDVKGFVDRGDGVDVAWTSSTRDGVIRCGYLVGCDGGRSAVRKKAGFAFPGTAPTMTMYQAIVDLDRPELLSGRGWHRTDAGVFAFGPLPGRLLMLDFSGPPEDRQAPVTREELETVLRRISGTDIGIETLKIGNRWTDNTRLVDSYRRGRIILAGDAAHVHSPFGGQGLSLGLVDAANLGWKLAAVLRGEMPDSLLDTYTAERRPVAEAVLANTLAQVAIMRPDPQSGAMRDIVARLLQIEDVSQFFGDMMSGLSARYDLGSAVDAVGRLVGDRPVICGGVETTLYESMQDGGWVFLDACAGATSSRLVADIAPKVRRIAVDSGPSLLIRPDGCVAWSNDGVGSDGLEAALRRWLGPPASETYPVSAVG